MPNFCAIVSAAGKIDFAVIRRLPGQRTPITRRLGQYPLVGLAEAREAARKALVDISAGVDPKERQAAERRAETLRAATAFGAVCEDFIARHVRKLRSAGDVEATIRRELISRWGERPFALITRRDVVEAIEQIADSGRLHVAHHVFSYASKLFNWAVTRDLYGLEISPCAGIKRSEMAAKLVAVERGIPGTTFAEVVKDIRQEYSVWKKLSKVSTK